MCQCANTTLLLYSVPNSNPNSVACFACAGQTRHVQKCFPRNLRWRLVQDEWRQRHWPCFYQPAGLPRAAEDQSMIQRFGCSAVDQTRTSADCTGLCYLLTFLVITVIVIIVLVIKFVSFFCTNYNNILFILIKRWNLRVSWELLAEPSGKKKQTKKNGGRTVKKKK